MSVRAQFDKAEWARSANVWKTGMTRPPMMACRIFGNRRRISGYGDRFRARAGKLRGTQTRSMAVHRTRSELDWSDVTVDTIGGKRTGR